MGATRADFSGYATKAGLKCSDGLIIKPEAFKHMDKLQVPLVWQHGHSNPENVLGHAVLESRPDGVYAYGYFNGTKNGKDAKEFVQHKDIKFLSIYANRIQKSGNQVTHGEIREVSLVMAGANPGAVIDWVQIAHGDGVYEDLDDEAKITTGIEIEHADGGDGPTAREVFDSMTEEQQGVVSYMVSVALAEQVVAQSDNGDSAKATDDAEPDDKKTNDGTEPDDKEGTDTVAHNVFDQTGKDTKVVEKHVLTHSDMQEIVEDWKKVGSFKEAVKGFAIKHGITSLETLFPDPKTLNNTPDWNSRRMEWVPGVLNGTRKSPFSRVKSIVADITQDQARALGYIKGTYKKEEWFGLTSRITTPTTVFKKQKLDRDDIIDIADFDTVAWMRAEMRMMLEEELARAVLIGDGRDPGDPDKIKDPGAAAEGAGIRAISNENELYATTVNVNLTGTPNYELVVESVLRARRFYKGTGTPDFYTTAPVLVEMLLTKDGFGRRMWANKSELAAALMVNDIIEVEVMETEPDLLGIIVNLTDYNIGADKGGEVNLFDDFDIDYNQYKYLIETRISGALVKIKSALVIKITDSENVLVQPIKPTFVSSTGVVTIPSQTGVVYKNEDTAATLTAGAQTALDPGETLNVIAVPASGYYFATNAEDQWPFTRPAA